MLKGMSFNDHPSPRSDIRDASLVASVRASRRGFAGANHAGLVRREVRSSPGDGSRVVVSAAGLFPDDSRDGCLIRLVQKRYCGRACVSRARTVC